MTGALKLSRRNILLLVLGLALLLVALMPMRFAMAMVGRPITASRAAGLVWVGAIGDLTVGNIRFGNVEAGLKPLPLLIGRREFWIERIITPESNPLSGTFLLGTGVRDLTGVVDISGLFPLLPLSSANFDGFSTRFENGRCAEAKGNVRVEIDAGGLPGIDLKNGLLGAARCEGRNLLIPLASQSAMERVDLRLSANGEYSATLTISSDIPEAGAALGLVGFQPISGGYQLVRRGKF